VHRLCDLVYGIYTVLNESICGANLFVLFLRITFRIFMSLFCGNDLGGYSCKGISFGTNMGCLTLGIV
jgi:hypothetical protein